MSFSFRYQPAELESGDIIKRPLIPLILIGKNEKLDVLGYLDTGSDLSVISKGVADIIGVDYIEETEISGVTGDKMKVDISYIDIIFGGGHEEYQFKIPILISRKNGNQVIIGRKGFFDQFKITFVESEKKISFEKFQERFI